MSRSLLLLGCLCIGLSGCSQDTSSYSSPSSSSSEDCDIKGNISYNTGEKIYHLPGDTFYDRTIIDESEGEQWFCTEQEAVDAGFRHSER